LTLAVIWIWELVELPDNLLAEDDLVFALCLFCSPAQSRDSQQKPILPFFEDLEESFIVLFVRVWQLWFHDTVDMLDLGIQQIEVVVLQRVTRLADLLLVLLRLRNNELHQQFLVEVCFDRVLVETLHELFVVWICDPKLLMHSFVSFGFVFFFFYLLNNAKGIRFFIFPGYLRGIGLRLQTWFWGWRVNDCNRAAFVIHRDTEVIFFLLKLFVQNDESFANFVHEHLEFAGFVVKNAANDAAARDGGGEGSTIWGLL
jgi:hypothetical protein